jgi:hypothetical protein
MRIIYLVVFFDICDCIPRIWREPCRQEFNIIAKNQGCSRGESIVLADLVLFETESLQNTFHPFIKERMCFLHTNENYSIQMLGIFHITAFYIERSQRKCRPPKLPKTIHTLLENIRQLRCELEINTKPLPWRQLKARMANLDLCNKIFEDYLLYSLRIFLNAIKHNTLTTKKITRMCV